MGTRILTVEDDERIRTAVKLALEDEGWNVDEADTGEDALERFGRQPSDVVLIDIMLPDIDGFEVCRAIRRTSDVPIIMVTARDDTHDVVAGLEAGADDYLTKPFAPKELSARIRAMLRRVRAMDPAAAHLVFGDLEIVPEEGVVRRGGARGAPHQDRVPPAGRARLQPRAGCSPARSCSSGCGATATSATAAWSTSTSAGCAPRSRPTRPTRATSSPCAASATSSRPDRPAGRPCAMALRRLPRAPRLGLRSRITLAFAASGLLLSALLAGSTWAITRESLLTQREATATRQAYQNARYVQTQIPDEADAESIRLAADRPRHERRSPGPDRGRRRQGRVGLQVGVRPGRPPDRR